MNPVFWVDVSSLQLCIPVQQNFHQFLHVKCKHTGCQVKFTVLQYFLEPFSCFFFFLDFMDENLPICTSFTLHDVAFHNTAFFAPAD